MAYDFINTTLTNATLTGTTTIEAGVTITSPALTTATLTGITSLASASFSSTASFVETKVTGLAYNPTTGLTMASKTFVGISAILSGSVGQATVTSSLNKGAILYFVNGLLVSSSV